MPKYRQLHTKVIDSFDFNEMPDDFTRVVWLLLTLILDSEGRGIDNPSWIKSKMFPLRTDIDNQKIEESFNWFSKHKMIVRYSKDKHNYFYIPTFKLYQSGTQKEALSVLPAPDKLKTYSGEEKEEVGAAASASASASESALESESEFKEVPPLLHPNLSEYEFQNADNILIDDIFLQVTGFLPSKEKDNIRKTIMLIADRENIPINLKNKPKVADILRPYFLEMCRRKNKNGQPYSRNGLFWLLEWASIGEIPPIFEAKTKTESIADNNAKILQDAIDKYEAENGES